MKIPKVLHNYLTESKTDPKSLDLVTNEFKSLIIQSIVENYIDPKISSQKTRDTLKKNISNLIKQEYNTLTIPYYHILENLNLCIEVEMSDKIVTDESNETFGKYKFSEILENGIVQKKSINRFDINESKFMNELENTITKFTKDFKVSDDLITIEFN